MVTTVPVRRMFAESCFTMVVTVPVWCAFAGSSFVTVMIVVTVPVGMSLGLVWKMSDALNGMMAIPNLLALLLLSPVVFKLTKQYFQQQDNQSEAKVN